MDPPHAPAGAGAAGADDRSCEQPQQRITPLRKCRHCQKKTHTTGKCPDKPERKTRKPRTRTPCLHPKCEGSTHAAKVACPFKTCAGKPGCKGKPGGNNICRGCRDRKPSQGRKRGREDAGSAGEGVADGGSGDAPPGVRGKRRLKQASILLRALTGQSLDVDEEVGEEDGRHQGERRPYRRRLPGWVTGQDDGDWDEAEARELCFGEDNVNAGEYVIPDKHRAAVLRNFLQGSDDEEEDGDGEESHEEEGDGDRKETRMDVLVGIYRRFYFICGEMAVYEVLETAQLEYKSVKFRGNSLDDDRKLAISTEERPAHHLCPPRVRVIERMSSTDYATALDAIYARVRNDSGGLPVNCWKEVSSELLEGGLPCKEVFTKALTPSFADDIRRMTDDTDDDELEGMSEDSFLQVVEGFEKHSISQGNEFRRDMKNRIAAAKKKISERPSIYTMVRVPRSCAPGQQFRAIVDGREVLLTRPPNVLSGTLVGRIRFDDFKPTDVPAPEENRRAVAAAAERRAVQHRAAQYPKILMVGVSSFEAVAAKEIGRKAAEEYRREADAKRWNDERRAATKKRREEIAWRGSLSEEEWDSIFGSSATVSRPSARTRPPRTRPLCWCHLRNDVCLVCVNR